MTRSSTLALFRGCVAVTCLFPVLALSAPDTSGLTMDQRLNRLERIVDGQNAAQLMFNIERLQREAEALRGQLDEAVYELQQLKRQQKELYLDLDQRLQALETQGAAGASGGSGGLVAPVLGGDANTAGGAVGAEPELSLDEAGIYQKAFSELKAGEYPQALATFQSFLQTYPQGTYSDNAQYWLGEVHYVMRNYKAAIAEFDKVVKNFPNSPKVPDAFLKTGFAYYELKEWKKSSQALMQVVQRYPSSSAARLAERRIQQMKLDGQL